MYTSYFGLNENPFSIAPDPLYLYMSDHHREALAHLQYGIKSDGGFVLLTGEVGTGKTTLCRSLLEQLPEGVDVAFVLNPKVSAIELLETICDELRIERPEQASIKKLVDLLNFYLLDANARGRKTVLFIDEAQNLSIDVLEQLRLLTNLETNRYKLLQIVLLGQPELLQILNRQDMRQLSQRVTARCHLGPLGLGEIDSYVRHRLGIAGCSRPLFPENLSKTLWKLTGGTPRLINLVCDRALLGAYALERKQVDGSILRQAAREVLGDYGSPAKSGRLVVAGVACVFLLLFAAGFWSWQTGLFFIPPRSAEVGLSAQTLPVSNVAESPEVSVASTETLNEPLPLTWPDDFAKNQSMEKAFSDLAGLWGLAAAKGPDYCSYAFENGLNCLARSDSLETLKHMNRPVILRLYNDDGTPFHAVMARLEQDKALFIAEGKEYELPLALVTPRWFGDYLLLWQRPPLKRTILKPGETGDSVKWLAKTLQELGLYVATGHESRMEGSLLGAFKRFQLSNGLTPDGVLGPMSLIHLGTALNQPGPRLSPPGAF